MGEHWSYCLMHHGIHGQKWGVRNGPPYPLNTPANRVKKTAKTKKDVDDIVSTLSNKERKRLGLKKKDEEYLTLEQGEHVVYRALKKCGDIPVSFFDLIDTGDNIEVALATRSGNQYRGKGYAFKAAKQAMNYISKHPELRKNKDIVWESRKDNTASIKTAKKMGFVEDPSGSKNGRVKYVNRSK